KILYKEIQHKESITFSESLNSDENSWISNGYENYSNELLFSCYSDPGMFSKKLPDDFQLEANDISYSYNILEDWIFLKLYYNSIYAERLILNAINEIISKIKEKR